MNCLLCNRLAVGLLRVGSDRWRLGCPACGEYEFAGPFAEHVKVAKAKARVDVLRRLPRLARASQRARTRGQRLTLEVRPGVEIVAGFQNV